MNRRALFLLTALLPASCETLPSPADAPGAPPLPGPREETAAAFAPLTEKDLALFQACGALNFATVRSLLAAGANPNARDTAGRTPLMMLARTQPPDLGQADEPEWDEDGTGLDAQTSPHYFILEELCRRRADLNVRDSEGRTALMHAARADYANLVTGLIRRGADPGVRDNTGSTALTIARQAGNVSAAEAIVKASMPR